MGIRVTDREPWRSDVAHYVERTLYGHTSDRYLRRVACVIPAGDRGGIALVRDDHDARMLWVDAALAKGERLPSPRAANQVARLLAKYGYEILVTETWREPKMKRYWRACGWQDWQDEAGTFSIWILSQSSESGD